MRRASEGAGTAVSAIIPAYHALRLRRFAIICGLAIACVLALVLDLGTGPSALGLSDIMREMLHPGTLTDARAAIIWQVRLPYALMAVFVGAALSLAGAEMQTILNNPLASPFTLGVSSAASFGAALSIVLGFGIPFIPSDWSVSFNAFAFAFGSVLFLEFISRTRNAGVETIVLLGIAMVFAFNAAVALVQFVSSQEALQQFIFWSMGSLSRATWRNVGTLAVIVLLIIPFSLRASAGMTALRLGEDRARSFGVDVSRLRIASLFRVSLLAATAVAFVGTIGFIGLVGPHIARLLVGEDHRFLASASVLTGALIMSLASVLSKILVPGALMPVGIVTAMIGVPIFLTLILRRRERM